MSAAFWRSFHGWMTIAWATIGLGLSILLRDSVAWVVFMSLYACVGYHHSSWQASRAEESVEEGPVGPHGRKET